LNRTAYVSDGYYGRWLNGAELMLTENGLLAPSAIEVRVRNLRGEQIEEPPAPQPVTRDYAATAEGSLRVVDRAPAFEVGE
jgi:nitrile hydratase subunit beta